MEFSIFDPLNIHKKFSSYFPSGVYVAYPVMLIGEPGFPWGRKPSKRSFKEENEPFDPRAQSHRKLSAGEDLKIY